MSHVRPKKKKIYKKREGEENLPISRNFGTAMCGENSPSTCEGIWGEFSPHQAVPKLPAVGRFSSYSLFFSLFFF